MMNHTMQITPAFAASGTTGVLDGVSAVFGTTRQSDGRLPLVSRRQRRQARRRRLM